MSFWYICGEEGDLRVLLFRHLEAPQSKCRILNEYLRIESLKFSYLSNIDFSNTHYMSGIVLGTMDTTWNNKTYFYKNVLWSLHSSEEARSKKEIIKLSSMLGSNNTKES